MNERIREIAEHCDFYVGNEHYDKSHEEQQRLFMEKFAQMIADHCASICMSQADRKNIRNAFGVPVESNIKYKGPDPSNSIQSQYDRELNTNRIQ
jgi:hypothetical protein